MDSWQVFWYNRIASSDYGCLDNILFLQEDKT
ncbi:hypothetical protein BN3662_03009 [Clostridiales bacterium CHKCI006]|nr:hypothetical protein BN3662_03009 [Clostridiales bacterium CHKCI006]